MDRSLPFLTCVVVKHSGHILLWEGVIGIAHQQAGFSHSAIPNHHTLQHLLLLAATAAAAAVISLLAVHSCGSSCCDCAAAVAESPASPKAHETVGSQSQAEITLPYFGYLGPCRLVRGSWHMPSCFPCW